MRERFLELRGLREWNASTDPWQERGYEQGAEIISWAIGDRILGAQIPSNDPVQIGAAFEVLTGVARRRRLVKAVLRRSGSGRAGFPRASRGSRPPGTRRVCCSSGRSAGAAARRSAGSSRTRTRARSCGALDPLGQVQQAPVVRDEPEGARELALGVVEIALPRVQADHEHRDAEPEPKVVDLVRRHVVVEPSSLVPRQEQRRVLPVVALHHRVDELGEPVVREARALGRVIRELEPRRNPRDREDPAAREVMVNGLGDVYVERKGRIERVG